MTSNNPHIPRPTIQPHHGTQPPEHIRQPDSFQVSGNPVTEPAAAVALAAIAIQKTLMKQAVMMEDRSRPVDEYNIQMLQPQAFSTITVQPQWEVSERIESILITALPGQAVGLQLGDRNWSPLIIPPSGILVIAPVSLYLMRDDLRILSNLGGGTAGVLPTPAFPASGVFVQNPFEVPVTVTFTNGTTFTVSGGGAGNGTIGSNVSGSVSFVLYPGQAISWSAATVAPTAWTWTQAGAATAQYGLELMGFCDTRGGLL